MLNNLTLAKLKRKSKAELAVLADEAKIELEHDDTNALIAMKIFSSIQSKIDKGRRDEQLAKNQKEDLAKAKRKKKVKSGDFVLTVHPTKDDTKKPKPTKKPKKANKKPKASKSQEKKRAQEEMMKMIMSQLVSDAVTSAEPSIRGEGTVFVIPASLIGPNSKYKIVKTYSVSRSAWMGNGKRNKQTGLWEGHRHPAPRALLYLGYESYLKKESSGWSLVIQPVENFAQDFLSKGK